MKLQTAWIMPLLAIVALALGASPGQAQSFPGSPYDSGGEAAYPPGPYGMMGSPYPDQPGSYVMPAGGMAPDGGFGPAGPEMGYGGTCQACGGGGCEMCAGGGYGSDFDFNFLQFLLPYGEGGICAPRWYDAFVDLTYLRREDVGRRKVFASDGVAGLADPVIILSTDNLDFGQEEAGLRAGLAYQLGPGMSIEGTYAGMNEWSTSAFINDPTSNIFSVFSDFGNNPPPRTLPNGVAIRGGFQETDAALFSQIEYGSRFDTADLGLRKRWVGPNCRLHGSWLLGVRYFQLQEDFRHRIFVDYASTPAGSFIRGNTEYTTNTLNNMTGFQAGGDLWLSLIPGLRFGSELKLGVYGNRATQQTRILANDINGPSLFLFENVDHIDAAFVGELNLQSVWRLSQHWTVRTGYMFMYVDGVALAVENFNDQPPFVTNARTPFINDNGNVFLHGGTAGIEFMW